MSANVLLTPRDIALLQYVGANKAAPLDVVAAKYFAEHAGVANKDPAHACRRRMKALSDAGYVALKSIPGQKAGQRTQAVTLTRKAADSLGAPRPAKLHPKGRDHHMATLRAVEQLRTQLAKRGESIVSVMLEHALRSEVQRGRGTQRGDTFDSFPDAVVIVRGANGDRRCALEYVTSKYTNQMIVEKADDFASYDETIWVADKISTTRRVEALTGQTCAWL